jgi:hypothetical protein
MVLGLWPLSSEVPWYYLISCSMPRARHRSDSSDNASEVECEDAVVIVATAATAASSAKQTRKVKARPSVSTQLAKMGCKANAFRILGVSQPQGKALQKVEVHCAQQASGSCTRTTRVP